MSTIETVICLILLFMAVPDLCKRLGRPALAYSIFILFGFIAGPLVKDDARDRLVHDRDGGSFAAFRKAVARPNAVRLIQKSFQKWRFIIPFFLSKKFPAAILETANPVKFPEEIKKDDWLCTRPAVGDDRRHQIAGRLRPNECELRKIQSIFESPTRLTESICRLEAKLRLCF